jgi:hypothetical protein
MTSIGPDVLEALFDLSQEALDEYVRRFQRHSFSARLDAHHSIRFMQSQVTCTKSDLFVLSGRDRTNGSGTFTISLHRLLCEAAFEGLPSNRRFVIVGNPGFVATPLASSPVLVTVQTESTVGPVPPGFVVSDRGGNSVEELPSDVAVTVASWNLDGSPEPRLLFSWICAIEAARATFFGG